MTIIPSYRQREKSLVFAVGPTPHWIAVDVYPINKNGSWHLFSGRMQSMDSEVREKPIDVDVLFRMRPELFPHAIPTLEKRRTVFVGELVKIAVGIRENERLVSGRWLIVESISNTERGLRAVGRSWKSFYKDDFCYGFGPENIYRMEPRKFFLWGSGGIPIAMRSGNGPDERIPARPVDAQEQYIEECENVVLEFSALGRRAAEARYCELASKNTNWPSYNDLK